MSRPVCRALAGLVLLLFVAASRADDLVPGARGTVVTVLEGTQKIEIPLTFLGTYHDFAGPGYDLHLVELEGPAAEEVGVAAGMSGSPVYIDDRLIGALAYRLGALPRRPVAGVTPIADVLDASRASAPPDGAAAASAGITPIATPILVGGLHPAVRQWIAPHLEQRGFVAVAGGAAAGGSPGAGELSAGSPVGVQLLRGDMRIAATGTVTHVHGDTVYAFGHPMLGTGRVSMPMTSAEVIHTLSDLAGSIKLANIGEELGAIVEDRRSAIVGRRGQRAAMIPLQLTIVGGDYGEQSLAFEMIDDPDLSPLLAAVAVANSLRINDGYTARSTVLAHGRVRLGGGLGDLPIDLAFSGDGGSDPGSSLAGRLLETLNILWNHPLREFDVDGIELRVDSTRDPVSYRLERLIYDRRPLAPGATLAVRCLLRQSGGGTVWREFEIPLPDTPGEGGFVLAVGNPSEIDAALGTPLAARLASASDAASMLRVLGDRRGRHRLTAVLYQAGKAVIADGAAYAGLPPSAQRLLATRTARSSTGRPTAVSPLARLEQTLDGPVVGGKQIRLQLDSRVGQGGRP